MPALPAAFMSYVRFNDQHDDGQVTQFCERLSAEVRAQTGEEFAIFQDRNDIAWGQNWQQRIDQTLDLVTLLIPIITPSFFKSPACRAEVERFLKREQQLGRSDLVLPVYYITTPELDDPERRDADELARALASRQVAEWRELRFEPFTSPVARKALAQLASRMRDTFWHQPSAPSSRPRKPRPATTEAAGAKAATPESAAAAKPAAKTEPPTHVVDAYQRGDFDTIGAAINAARPGDRILVRPGLYQEGLVVDKPLEIVGDGPVEDIEIQARGADALLFKANIGRVANLTFRQAGGDGTWYGVDITQGRLDLEGCDITSQSLTCVAIHNGADPRLRRNRIHGGKQSGVYVYEDGLGTLEDNDITANGASGGVAISEGGNPTLRRNQIHDNEGNGVYAYEGGLGTLEDNDIIANGMAGVRISEDSNLTLRGNRINRNAYEAVWVDLGSRALVELNDLTGNERGAWDIAEASRRNVKRSDNKT